MKKLVTLLFAERKNLAGAHGKWGELDPERTKAVLKAGTPVPAHPGATAATAGLKPDSAAKRAYVLEEYDTGYRPDNEMIEDEAPVRSE